MKNKKLNLKTLQVESFVTDLKKSNSMTVKGGTSGPQSGDAGCTLGEPCTHMLCITMPPCLPTSTTSGHNPE